ncbi:MAG: TIGR02996 domain-containing protein [Fimbriiglobus sp.]
MSDRETFIQSIAQEPENRLRKLVFADWLEEHGEAERAEFIRLSIACLEDGPEQSLLLARRNELFLAHAARWFEPFLTSLDPSRVITDYRFEIANDQSPEIRTYSPAKFEHEEGFRWRFLGDITLVDGFVNSLNVTLSALSKGCSTEVAFRQEPVSELKLELSKESDEWLQFTSTALSQVKKLTVTGFESSQWKLFFNQNHFERIQYAHFEIDEHIDGPIYSVPYQLVRDFCGSKAAHQIDELILCLRDDGLQAFAESPPIGVQKLMIYWIPYEGDYPAGGETFANSELVKHLPRLEFRFIAEDDDVLVKFGQWGGFSSLKNLEVHSEAITSRGFWALAQSQVMHQLEELTIDLDCLNIPQESDLLELLQIPKSNRKLKLTLTKLWGETEWPTALRKRFRPDESM